MAGNNGPDVKTGDMPDAKMLLHVLKAVKRGDLTARLPVEWTGISGKIADELNSIIEMNAKIAAEFKRVSHVVGKKGRLLERASISEAGGAWESNVEAINELIDDLVRPTSEMARVIGAVAKGGLAVAEAYMAGWTGTAAVSKYGKGTLEFIETMEKAKANASASSSESTLAVSCRSPLPPPIS